MPSTYLLGIACGIYGRPLAYLGNDREWSIKESFEVSGLNISFEDYSVCQPIKPDRRKSSWQCLSLSGEKSMTGLPFGLFWNSLLRNVYPFSWSYQILIKGLIFKQHLNIFLCFLKIFIVILTFFYFLNLATLVDKGDCRKS